MKTIVALVTGGTKGVGYCISKELVSRISKSMTYMTSRENTAGYSSLMAMELGFAASQRSKFLTMDIRDKTIVKAHRDDMMATWGGLDILINNAGIYYEPDRTKYIQQAHATLDTNYFGTQNVIKTFYEDFRPNARIVNITSNLAHVTSVITPDQIVLKQKAREKFAEVDTYEKLDNLVHQFITDVDSGYWEEKGWPTCAYSVSKMAINTYTRILQKDFDDSDRNILVNAVYPASHHKLIDQADQRILSDEDAAKFVFNIAMIQPDSQGRVPRGIVIWDERKLSIDGAHNNEYCFNTKLSTESTH